MGKGDATTHLVQVVDKPHRVIVFEVFFTLHIFLPVKHIIESVSKIRRGPVKATEFSQCWGAGRGHENKPLVGEVSCGSVGSMGRYMYWKPHPTHEASV